MACQLSEARSAMTMRIAKSGPDFRDGFGNFIPQVRRQPGRGFPGSFGEQDANHSLPVKALSLNIVKFDDPGRQGKRIQIDGG